MMSRPGSDAGDGGGNRLAPVIPLFGAEDDVPPATWHTTWTEPVEDVSVVDADDDADERAAEAEAALLRKLRTRSLSVREARRVLVEHEIDEPTAGALIDRFERNGYLDDARLAEQLIHSAVARKSQGRVVVSRTLAQRGIPREVIDAALDDLPDDERERALEFARGKARSMRGLAREVALRRLVGQLARRGYGAQSLEAARTALDELAQGRKPGVRFEP